ncbi:phenylalanine--tRNA ligase subunit beta [Isobaculum melis]|uniref:Phenylalanine--tRNA ligase beta subunit n=1 Tax=Isobaculum melis TaxID=142588 RepID=A0A1H9RHW4_9LACT|nr:phenylalanine--tRNA ligase subunit beta [Isobaculum melis]SER72400.1 phenylalanyl-tRNA synthetase beta subunit [Isobaculum melis]
MYVSYQWLTEYFSMDGITPDALGDKMSRTGIEVEDVVTLSEGLKKIVVGHVLSAVPHPDSDHLNICQVNVGEEEPSQIVCGAPNVAAGQHVIVALPGARITGNVKIKKGKMRGEVSNGMICSLQEVGFDDKVIPKAYAEGIYLLPEDAIPGDSVFPYLGMDDAILELSITPNRADALSMRGVAHEVGAIYDKKPQFKAVELNEAPDDSVQNYVKVAVENAEDAPFYTMRVIKNVTIAESPAWLKNKLMHAGIRPINNVVDITNYILLEYGQPLHAFDYDRLATKEIAVRRAQAGEKFLTLDGEERSLSSENIVITNGQEPVALAGVMGGLTTEIVDETVTVALEAALFNPTSVRKTSKAFNLRSESSSRFEKGINQGTVEEASRHAASLIAELAEGTVVSGVEAVGAAKTSPVELDITLERINHILGTAITAEEVVAIFDRLGFTTKEQEGLFQVCIPPRRWDISIEADLVEEVARIYGYDRLPSHLPVTESQPGKLSQQQQIIRNTRGYLEGAGLSQAISYVLTTPKKAQAYMMRASEPTKLLMPMSEDRSTLRMNLLSGLLDDVHYNVARKNTDVALYEIGRVFYQSEDPSQTLLHEEEHVAGVMTGLTVENDWQHAKKATDFFVLKGVVEGLLASYGLKEAVKYVPMTEKEGMHPGRTAAIYLGEKELGFLGQIHPFAQKEYEVGETYVFEMNLQAIIDAAKEAVVYQTIPKYPEMKRDIALLVDEAIQHQELSQFIYEKGGRFLKDVKLFDIYQGEKIEAGKKSMAYTLTFLNNEATLTDEEVTLAFDKVQKALIEVFAVTIR